MHLAPQAGEGAIPVLYLSPTCVFFHLLVSRGFLFFGRNLAFTTSNHTKTNSMELQCVAERCYEQMEHGMTEPLFPFTIAS